MQWTTWFRESNDRTPNNKGFKMTYWPWRSSRNQSELSWKRWKMTLRAFSSWTRSTCSNWRKISRNGTCWNQDSALISPKALTLRFSPPIFEIRKSWAIYNPSSQPETKSARSDFSQFNINIFYGILENYMKVVWWVFIIVNNSIDFNGFDVGVRVGQGVPGVILA